MKIDILIYAFAAALLVTILPAEAEQSSDSDQKYENWQLQRLFEPNEQQIKQERKGMVFIYDGVKSSDINQVMHEQFDRLQSMMFTGTIITDQDGEPLLHPETGMVMREEDGC